MADTARVTVWNEDRHEKKDEEVATVLLAERARVWSHLFGSPRPRIMVS
jgi:hypothetical protein